MIESSDDNVVRMLTRAQFTQTKRYQNMLDVVHECECRPSQYEPCMNSMPLQFISPAISLTNTAPLWPTDSTVSYSQAERRREM